MRKNIKKILFLHTFFLLILITGCEKSSVFEGFDEYVQISSLDGVWVEKVNQKDTIDFDAWLGTNYFILKRGLVYRNGYYIPKEHSGPYEYEISKDSITLQWGLSSSYNYDPYYFRVNKSLDAFMIGNFIYDNRPKTGILIFERIE